jgi:hypothetical protein
MAAAEAPEVGSPKDPMRRILYFHLRLRKSALRNPQFFNRGEVLPTEMQRNGFAESERLSVDGKACSYTFDLRAPVLRKCIRIENVEV